MTAGKEPLDYLVPAASGGMQRGAPTGNVNVISGCRPPGEYSYHRRGRPHHPLIAIVTQHFGDATGVRFAYGKDVAVVHAEYVIQVRNGNSSLAGPPPRNRGLHGGRRTNGGRLRIQSPQKKTPGRRAAGYTFAVPF